MTMQRTKLASLKEEVLEEGAAKRPIYTPRGAPLRAYQEWLASTDSKPTGKDNFCHYSRVVAKVYLGRLKAFVQAHKSIQGVLLGALISTLAVLIAMMGLTSTVIGTVAWMYAGIGMALALDYLDRRKSGKSEDAHVPKTLTFVRRYAWVFAPASVLFFVLLWPFYTKPAKRFYAAFGEHVDTILVWTFLIVAGTFLVALGFWSYYGFGGDWVTLGMYIGTLCAVTMFIVYKERTKPAREAKVAVAKAAAVAKALESKRRLVMSIYDVALRKWYDADEGIRSREPDYEAFLTRVAAAHVASNGSYVYEGVFFAHTLMFRFYMSSEYYDAVNGAAVAAAQEAEARRDTANVTSGSAPASSFADTPVGKVLVGIGDFASLAWAYIRVFKWWFACPFIEIPVASSDEDSKTVM